MKGVKVCKGVKGFRVEGVKGFKRVLSVRDVHSGFIGLRKASRGFLCLSPVASPWRYRLKSFQTPPDVSLIPCVKLHLGHIGCLIGGKYPDKSLWTPCIPTAWDVPPYTNNP